MFPTLVGHRVDQLASAISSMFLVIGDLDR